MCGWMVQFVFYMDVGSRWWIVGLWPKSVWKFILLFFFLFLSSAYIRQGYLVFSIEEKLPLVYCNHNKKLLFFSPVDVALLKVNHVILCVFFLILLSFTFAAQFCVYDISSLLHFLLLFLVVLHHFHNSYYLGRWNLNSKDLMKSVYV